MSPLDFGDLVVIGRIVKPQGRTGELLVESLSDKPDRFPSLNRAFLESEPGRAEEVCISSCRSHKSRWVLKLDGIDTIDAAERLRGRLIAIGEKDLETLPPGAFYHFVLRGLTVVTENGVRLGRVDDVVEAGAAPILVVNRGPDEKLIPFAESFVRDVRPEEGRIVVTLQEIVDADD
jgi:16S rRNA processing protein RimM